MTIRVIDAEGEPQVYEDAEGIRHLSDGSLLVIADIQADPRIGRAVALYPPQGWRRTVLEGDSSTVQLPDFEVPAGGEWEAREIGRLAQFIAEAVPGEPSRSEGAIDTAIRLLAEHADCIARRGMPAGPAALLGDAQAEEPLNPQESAAAGRSPFDSVTLTFGELRQLLALHLDQARLTMGSLAPWADVERQARAMRDGETPLRLAEVLNLPHPAAEPTRPPVIRPTGIVHIAGPDRDYRVVGLDTEMAWDQALIRCRALDAPTLEPEPADVEPLILFDRDPGSLASAIQQAGGAFSVCWSSMSGAGVFLDSRALAIAEQLQEWIEERYEPRIERAALRVGDRLSVEDAEGKGLTGTLESWHPVSDGDVLVLYARVG